jgi:hypothetical protein
LSILSWNARKSRVCAASRPSQGTAESPNAGIAANVAAFISARRSLGALCANVKTISASQREGRNTSVLPLVRRYGFVVHLPQSRIELRDRSSSATAALGRFLTAAHRGMMLRMRHLEFDDNATRGCGNGIG